MRKQPAYVEKRDGGFYVAGTRVSLDSVVYAFRDGQSPESIQEDFDTLSLEQVYGAITFYLANHASIDHYLLEQKERIATLKRQSEPLPPELAARLKEARERVRQGK